MRLARYTILGLALVFLTISPAHADNQPRIFGSANCHQTFACTNLSATALATLATECSVSGLGISKQPGLFDGASLDSNNCVTTSLGSSGGSDSNGTSHQSVAQCCISGAEENCSMRCQLLMY